MLRNDAKHMIDTDWEPKIPDVRIIRKQCKKFTYKSFANVKLAEGRICTMAKSHDDKPQQTND